MESNKIICTNCGKEMKNTNKYCISCGTKNEAYVQDLDKKKSFKNKKLFVGVGVAVAVLMVIALVAPTIYALISPNNYVKSAFYNTIKVFEKDAEKFSNVPTLQSLLSTSSNNTQGELYLQIEDINAGVPVDISMLEDYGLKFTGQSNKDKNLWNFKLALMEDQKEILDGIVYYDEEKIALEVSKLFEDILAISIKESENSEDATSENTDTSEISSMIKMYSEMINSSKNIEDIYEELIVKYTNEFMDLVNFEKDKSNKNLYLATIAGENLVSIVRDFITELFNNEDFKEYLVSTMYFSEGYYSKDYYVDMVDNMALSMQDEFDYALEGIEVGELILNVEIEDKFVNNIDASFSITSYGEKLKMKYTMEFNNEKDNQGVDFELKFGIDSYDSIEGSLYYVNDDTGLNRDISFDINISELDSVISFDLEEVLKDGKKYENLIKCNISDGYDEVKIKFNTVGSYKNNDRIDYEDIGLNILTNGNEISCNLSGYAANSKIKSVDTVDDKKVVYIEELDELDFNELAEEINENLYLIFQSLEGII